MPEERKPCECDCGKYPKGPKSRFLPGHNIIKKYKDHPEQDQQLDEMDDLEKFGEK
jgi:hypothetical protein